jgi:hypothetical protein
MRTIVHVEQFPAAALTMLADELRGYGADVQFHTPSKGQVLHESGKLTFEHCAGRLSVTVIARPAFFPIRMLIGGIRQTCMEAAERFHAERPIKVETQTESVVAR